MGSHEWSPHSFTLKISSANQLLPPEEIQMFSFTERVGVRSLFDKKNLMNKFKKSVLLNLALNSGHFTHIVGSATNKDSFFKELVQIFQAASFFRSFDYMEQLWENTCSM